MGIAICYICLFNVAKNRIPRADQRPSYTDCDRCRHPTCRGHGTVATSDRFLCMRCIGAGAQ